MGRSGQNIEHDIITTVNACAGEPVIYDGSRYVIVGASKPLADSGEPKTDVFIRLLGNDGSSCRDVKISCKKRNAQFIENKMKTETMNAYWGDDAQAIISNKLKSSGLVDKIGKRQLIFPEGTKRIPGTLVVTQGYRLDLTLGKGGELSTKVYGNDAEGIKRFLSGDLLSDDKRNARVTLDGSTKRIDGAGVANAMYIDDDVPSSVQAIFDKISSIDDYANDIASNGGLNLELKAVNYRADRDKSADGNRSLAVMIEYDVNDDGSVTPMIVCDNPGDYKANDAAGKIRKIRDKISRKDVKQNQAKIVSTIEHKSNKTKTKLPVTRNENDMRSTSGSVKGSPKRSSASSAKRSKRSKTCRLSGNSGRRSVSDGVIEVAGYYRSNGVYVRGYTRRRRK